MPWGYAAGALIGVAGDALASDKNGGAGSSSSSTEPWAPATPWLLNNLNQGQALQDQYTARPFSARQNAAYDASYAQGDAMRALVPDLLGQLQQQPVGFDKNNRGARHQAWDWDSFIKTLGEGGSVRNARDPEPEPEPAGEFQQHDIAWNAPQRALIDSGRSPWLLGGGPDSFTSGAPGTVQPTGGYGSFKYGATKPKAGTKAYRDMQEYFLNGGVDPYGLYGEKNFGADYSWAGGLMGAGAATDDGGAAAAVGSSANF